MSNASHSVFASGTPGCEDTTQHCVRKTLRKDETTQHLVLFAPLQSSISALHRMESAFFFFLGGFSCYFLKSFCQIKFCYKIDRLQTPFLGVGGLGSGIFFLHISVITK